MNLSKFLDTYAYLKNLTLKFRYLIPYILIVVTFISLFGGVKNSPFGFVDDHEIFTFHQEMLPSVGGLANFFPAIYSKTEIGQFGKYPRFRPSFYFIRFAEIYVFKLNAAKYYRLRIIIGALFFCLVFYFYKSYYYSIPVLFGIFYFMTDFFWSDIFFRIGPAEFYCLVGLLLVLYSFYFNLSSHVRMFLYTFGMLILLGCKENFFPFMLLGPFLIWDDARLRTKVNFTFIFLYLVLIAYCSIIIASLLFNFLNAPVDIYGNSVSFSDRIAKVFGIFSSINFWILLLISLSSEALKIDKFSYKLRLFFHFTLLNYLFNFIFYNGNWPDINRYNVPGLVLFKLTILVFVLNILANRKAGLFDRMHVITAILLFMLSIPESTFGKLKEKLDIDVAYRQRIQFNIAYLKTFSVDDSDAMILLPSHPYDHELVWSFLVQMHQARPESSKFLKPQIPNQAGVQLFEGLTNDLNVKALNGDPSWNIKPLKEMKLKYEKCYLIFFHTVKKFDQIPNCKTSIPLSFE
jgi:hypothetical protein